MENIYNAVEHRMYAFCDKLTSSKSKNSFPIAWFSIIFLSIVIYSDVVMASPFALMMKNGTISIISGRQKEIIGDVMLYMLIT
jgi:hypothetical protein